MSSESSRIARRLAALVCGCLCGAALAAGSADTGSARGLIVKLREGAGSGRAQALAVETAGASASRAAERSERLRGVLAASGLPAARLRAVGSGFQHLDFGRRLDRIEAERLAAQLRARPEVEWVVPNERERRLQATTPSDPLFPADAGGIGGQWWLFPASGSNQVDIDLRRRGVPGLQLAWTTNNGSAATIAVAVLDTGITSHPDLDAHVLPGRDFVATVAYSGDGNGWDGDAHDPGDFVSAADRSANPTLFADCAETESSWHGTTIASILAALTNNGTDAAAVSWNGRVVPVRVAGKCGAEVTDILDGMRWAAGLPVVSDDGTTLPLNPNPVRIVNISFGGSAACNAAYQETIDELRTHGVLVVAAAGNEHGTPTRPASCQHVLGVTALNRDGFKASYANFGSSVAIATVGGDPREIGAWGMQLGDTGLLALGNAGAQAPGAPASVRVYGTSFSAPVAAGVAALMLAVNPALTVDQLIDGIKRSARPHVVAPRIAACSNDNPGRCICTTSTCGAGILDAPQALAYAANPTGYVVPARTAEVIDNADVDAAVALGPDRPGNAGSGSSGGSSSPDSGGGGGALGGFWIVGLLCAVAALRRRAPLR